MGDPTIVRVSLLFVGRSIIATFWGAVGLILICLPVLIGLLHEPAYGGYALLGIGAFSLILSQEILFRTQRQAKPRSSVINFFLMVFAFIYYNLVVLTTVAIAVAVLELGVPVAILVALFWPLWEVATAERNLPLSIAGFVAFTVYLLGFVWGVASQLTWDDISPLVQPIDYFKRELRPPQIN